MSSARSSLSIDSIYEHDLIHAVSEQQIRLALVVSRDVARLASYGRAVLANTRWEHTAIGPQLSAWLLERRAPLTPRLLREGLRGCLAATDSPMLCTEIDLLFEPSLRLDPLALFLQLSRQCPLIVLWSGSLTDTCLTYAVPEHAHYRTWNLPTGPEVRVFALPS